jgi:hypothetical protein
LGIRPVRRRHTGAEGIFDHRLIGIASRMRAAVGMERSLSLRDPSISPLPFFEGPCASRSFFPRRITVGIKTASDKSPQIILSQQRPFCKDKKDIFLYFYQAGPCDPPVPSVFYTHFV